MLLCLISAILCITGKTHDVSVSTIAQSSFTKSVVDQATQYMTPESDEPNQALTDAYSMAEVTYREVATQMESGGPSNSIRRLQELDTNSGSSAFARKSSARTKEKSVGTSSSYLSGSFRELVKRDARNSSSASSTIEENLESQVILGNIRGLFKSKENGSGKLERVRESATPSTMVIL